MGVSDVDRQLASLSPDQKRALAVLAAVERTTLSPDQLTRLAGVQDAATVVAQLRALGLVEARQPDRFTAVDFVRRSWELAGEAEGVLDRVTTLLEDGSFSRGDVDALLGLAEWAAGVGQWERLLKLVQAARLPLEAWRRLDAWIELVQRGQVAAARVGDGAAQVWLAREEAAALATARSRDRASGASRAAPRWQARLAYGLVGVVLAAGGFIVGAAVGDNGPDPAGAETGGVEPATVTVTNTETDVRTETQNVVETATATQTETTTLTETTTETVTVTAPIIP
jgi:hypothetical protein